MWMQFGMIFLKKHLLRLERYF